MTAQTQMRVALVVPCYNEAARLDRDAFRSALTAMPWLTLCFVDDGSTDATRAMLEEMQATDSTRIEVLALAVNGGKADAVRQGMQRVLESRLGERDTCCGFWDADLSAPLSELPALTQIFSREPGVLWVFAIRLRALGRNVTRGALRHYLGRIFATLTSLLLGVGVYDTQCGAKLFRVTPLLREVLSEPFVSRWVFDVELLSRADALLARDGGKRVADIVYEQPLREWHHRAGSKLGPMDFLRAAIDFLRIRRAQISWRNRKWERRARRR
jgi:dolichyl-phosphate beta-glucosyltransferase